MEFFFLTRACELLSCTRKVKAEGMWCDVILCADTSTCNHDVSQGLSFAH